MEEVRILLGKGSLPLRVFLCCAIHETTTSNNSISRSNIKFFIQSVFPSETYQLLIAFEVSIRLNEILFKRTFFKVNRTILIDLFQQRSFIMTRFRAHQQMKSGLKINVLTIGISINQKSAHFMLSGKLLFSSYQLILFSRFSLLYQTQKKRLSRCILSGHHNHVGQFFLLKSEPRDCYQLKHDH